MRFTRSSGSRGRSMAWETRTTGSRRSSSGTSRAVPAILLLLLLLAWHAAPTTTNGDMLVTDALITIWLDSIDRVRPEEYRPAAALGALPATVRSDSAMWSERFFASAANPH